MNSTELATLERSGLDGIIADIEAIVVAKDAAVAERDTLTTAILTLLHQIEHTKAQYKAVDPDLVGSHGVVFDLALLETMARTALLSVGTDPDMKGVAP